MVVRLRELQAILVGVALAAAILARRSCVSGTAVDTGSSSTTRSVRRKRPDVARPYRTWGYPVVPALFILASLGIALNTVFERPVESLFGLAILAFTAVIREGIETALFLLGQATAAGTQASSTGASSPRQGFHTPKQYASRVSQPSGRRGAGSSR